MNLSAIIELTRSRINRLVSPEAKQSAWQALLGLKDAAGESLCKLLPGLIIKESIRVAVEVLAPWIGNFMG